MKYVTVIATIVYISAFQLSLNSAAPVKDAATVKDVPVANKQADEANGKNIADQRQQKGLEIQLASLSSRQGAVDGKLSDKSADAAAAAVKAQPAKMGDVANNDNLKSMQPLDVPSFEKVPSDFDETEQLISDVDLSPKSVAEYLLVTGNWKVLEDALADLVESRLMGEEEAQRYYDEVNWEYEQALMQALADDKQSNDQEDEEAQLAQQEQWDYATDADSENDEMQQEQKIFESKTIPADEPIAEETNEEEQISEFLNYLLREEEAANGEEQEQEQEQDQDQDQEQEHEPEQEQEEENSAGVEEQTPEAELEELAKVPAKEPKKVVAATPSESVKAQKTQDKTLPSSDKHLSQ